ncbi:ABC transporter ATP-binding protein [Neorhizobium galegae]|uniref:ABC transporter ATP-binding protein n=1 Tax=Neorhizobium galegae TaxID=399 RepID=UPI0006221EB9|nr:sn-glycerol-3-phosphate ABC transporter ATP-binding protein UgpC [Neorhizobium galegae]CDZ38217.1 ATPase component of ABC-type sugar transporter [Neorhizobium galegae bv. officinalis]KAA9383922.1 sn-glycerol-3-phosphate ABC transporter ATP-binding protein UgpC [Neorhizobium galegae]KAB1115134.1 sn-glycerol-3-phosphate ABC transporter ATP-binding protein UgpC [Neorhizobium galegae]MCM2496782.1 sn-glycerol-3-phosphate ABC transporter ATP-binding protein UgpC [Neorhizobium galegae]MCQ1769176.1
MANVNLRDIRKVYNHTQVIHGVNVDIDDGEFVVLVGPSGCGKSTLLRMIAGLEEISDGQIHIGSTIVNEMSPKDRDIAMVFQSYALYPHMTVAQNMGFSLQLRGGAKPEIRAQVEKAAKILNLEALLERYPRQLSGGQRQRVAMGRAIVRNPQVFLFDEPLSNLDAKLRVTMRGEIKALHQRLGSTMIYVTHDQVEAMTMADKIVVMRDGFLEQVGTPLSLYDRPANVFVAGFIGSPGMNLLSGRYAEGNVGIGDIALPVSERPSSASEGRQVIYGIRPEHLILSGDGGVPLVVEVVEPTGAETHVIGRVAGQRVIGVFRERITTRPGDFLSIACDPAKVHLFDPQSEHRIN